MKLKKYSVFPLNINNRDYYSNKLFIFIDISGFTPLCDEFIKNSKYGAEKIGDLLNNIFSPVINVIYEKDGDVISFAGDALFASINKNDYTCIKKEIKKSVNDYSKKINRFLSVKIEIFDNKYFPYIIKGKKKKHFLFYNKNQETKNIIYENDVFPNEVFDIANSEFKGELRAVPIFFIHIEKKYTLNIIEPLLKYIIDIASLYGVYINKIEFLDKGWMLLLSSGLPIYSFNSQYKIFEFLKRIIKNAKKKKIEIRIGGTLRRGYAGIIGNNKRWEYTFIGSNVNLAARIAVKAEPYKIFTDLEFEKTIREKVKTIFISSNKYKGIEQNVDIYEIKDYKVKQEKNVYVGRKKEINEALNYINNPDNVLIVWGESGVGKTEFIKQLLNLIGKENILLKGIYSNHTPFYLFDEFLRKFNKGNVKTSKREIIQKIFRSIKKETIIFIDDVSYADEYSRDIIKWILSESNKYVNLIITAFNETDIKHIMPPVLSYNVKKIFLMSLQTEEVQDLFWEFTGHKINKKIAKNIVKITNGNPLFLVYLIKFMGKEIIEQSDTPYSLKELILLRVNEIPYKGENFVEGGAVYGDIFNALIVADAMKFDRKKLENIIEYSEHYGMIRKLNDLNTIVFSNAIIRETIYEKLLEKQINYIRVKLAEIILENNKYRKAKKIAAQLFYLANDIRYLKVVEDIINNDNTKDFESQRMFFIGYFKFIIKNKLYKHKNMLDILGKALDMPIFYFNGELANVLFDTAMHIKNWKNKERYILQIAQAMSSFLMDNKRANILLKKYKEKKEEDEYYKWFYAVINKYSEDPNIIMNIYTSIEDKILGKEKIDFYLNYLAYTFFIIGDKQKEKYVLKKLEKLKNNMNSEQKSEYYQLLNSLSMHRDEINKCIEYLNKLKKMKLDNKYYKFLTYNDLAIIYNQIGIRDRDNKILRKALIYMIKAYKFVKDAGMKSNMPLITTNLGSSYSSMGNIKKTIKYYYEGYLYGKDINHPVEVPYTMSRISRLAYTYGANKLAIKLSEDIINNHSQVGDLLPVANMILFNLRNNNENFNKGLKVAENYLNNGIGKCIGEITSELFWGGFLQNNNVLFKKSYKLMKKYKDKIPKRSIQKIADNIIWEILEIIINKKDTKQLKNQLNYINKIDKLLILKVIMNYILSVNAKTKNNKRKYLQEAYNMAKKLRLYSMLYKIIEFDEKNNLNIISQKSKTYILKQKEKIENISTIKEFYEFFN